MVTLTLLFLAGVCNGIMDTLSFHYGSSKFKFFRNEQWWNPKKSWKNKWRVNVYGDVAVGDERFFLSSTLLVMFTDAWHLFQGLMILCFMGAIVFYVDLIKVLPDHSVITVLIDILELHIAYSLGFALMWNVILPTKKKVN